MMGLHPETAPAAQLQYMAHFVSDASADGLREHAETHGWRGLSDADFDYGAELLGLGYPMSIALERLLSLATDVWHGNGEPVERWRCRACGDLHDCDADATDCCPPEDVYFCGRCEEEHWSYGDAEACCNPGGKA